MSYYKAGFFIALFLLMNSYLIDKDLKNIILCGIVGAFFLLVEKRDS
jgi:hypothetical protein